MHDDAAREHHSCTVHNIDSTFQQHLHSGVDTLIISHCYSSMFYLLWAVYKNMLHTALWHSTIPHLVAAAMRVCSLSNCLLCHHYHYNYCNDIFVCVCLRVCLYSEMIRESMPMYPRQEAKRWRGLAFRGKWRCLAITDKSPAQPPLCILTPQDPPLNWWIAKWTQQIITMTYNNFSGKCTSYQL